MDAVNDPSEVEILRQIKRKGGSDVSDLYGVFRISKQSADTELLIRRLSRLMEAGLIYSFDVEGRYFISEKGEDFLRSQSRIPIHNRTITMWLQVFMVFAACAMLLSSYYVVSLAEDIAYKQNKPIVSLTQDSETELISLALDPLIADEGLGQPVSLVVKNKGRMDTGTVVVSLDDRMFDPGEVKISNVGAYDSRTFNFDFRLRKPIREIELYKGDYTLYFKVSCVNCEPKQMEFAYDVLIT